MFPTWMELRIALRTLRRSKAFAIFSVLALALAIAANTTMSSLVDAVVYPRYAFPHPEQLVQVEYYAPGWWRNGGDVDIQTELTGASPYFEGVSGWGNSFPDAMPAPVIVGGQTMRVPTIHVADHYFQVVGSRPEHGALFAGSPDANRQLAVISDHIWRRLNGAHRAFVPFGISIGDNNYTVTGVLVPHGGAPADADLFLASPPADHNRVALVRLRPGVTRAQALGELNRLAPGFDPSHSPRASFRLGNDIAPTHAKIGGIPLALGLTTLAVLLIACANIANLLLARGMSRSRELATRLAFGASRLDIARLLFAESGIVALTGGVLGMVLSLWTIHLLAASLPANLQGLGLVEPQLSWRVAATGAGLTMFAAVAFGIAPMVMLRRVNVSTLLKGGGTRTTTVGGARFRLLVVVEVAAALTLAVSASMLAAAAGRIQFMNFGYDANNLVSAYVFEYANHGGPPGAQPNAHVTFVGGLARPDAADARALAASRNAELSSMRAMPGVIAATGMWDADLNGDIRVDQLDGTQPTVPAQYSTAVYFVDPSFLHTLGATPVAGRDFAVSEGGPIPSAIVDESSAKWLWPHSSPLGRLIHFGPTDNGQPWVRVVGVVHSLMFQVDCGIGEACHRPLILIANSPAFAAARNLGQYLIRTRGAPGSFVAQLTPLLHAANPDNPVLTTTWGDATGLDEARVSHDFIATLFLSFAMIGLLLALIGVYGVAAYGVEQRVREFGVRIALGARTADIIGLVLRDGNATALLGLAVGLLVANWGEQFIARFLFGFDDLEPYFLAAAVVALFAATVLAGIPPALRAARVNPVDTLRSE